MPLGLDQSVGNIGSHTTKTRIRPEGFFFSRSSIAEAPRKQVGQVGDSSSTKRSLSDAALKSLRNFSTFASLREVSGGWPGGVPFEPQRYHPARSARIIATNHSADLLRFCIASYPAIRLAMTCGKRITRKTTATANQNRTMLARLRLWQWLRRTYN